MNFEECVKNGYKTKSEFDKRFTAYTIQCIKENKGWEKERFYYFFRNSYSSRFSGDVAEQMAENKCSYLEDGFFWITEMVNFMKYRDTGRSEEISRLDYFLSGSHYTLSLPNDIHSYLDLVLDGLENNKKYPKSEINDSVKDGVSREIIEKAHYWVVLCYRILV